MGILLLFARLRFASPAHAACTPTRRHGPKTLPEALTIFDD
ncbi:conserved hypothetical protein [Burkholderia pseudomallei 406e]|nr:conserved hypothetical protein [Burkholderia pseudomallei 668]ABN93038.1 conserved hypothetical protein [Burkholderia pseudomallei 1106a]EBA50544.1 hypothetical protein BURPS305_5853 [Burkholderia pseudomallei 305]EDO88339.1 conserved hypothetical protein [Burkholderia pseudomallei 406e]EDO89529.1 conserved hypothetical protein [Burkholderia pseudomallei Pasteur 52237]EDU12520.1 conserved hypothetical protein [Burkholderia pseudomallei 1655]EEC34416.1 conserved hypothetical protein [Burkho